MFSGSRLDQLRLPAAHGAANQVLAQASKVEAALARLEAGGDPEALHDFRVALRRLRAWLRGFESVLAVRKRTRREVRKLAGATNAARDAQAALAWLTGAGEALPVRQRRAIRYLEEELMSEVAEATARIAAQGAKRWNRLARRLRRELMDRQPVSGVRSSFASAWADALEQALREGCERLAAARKPAGAGIHRYRISLKRIRYLIEPLREGMPAAAEGVKLAKKGQEMTGAINDLYFLRRWLAKRARRLAAERSARLFELRCAGREAEARRVAASPHYRLTPLVLLARNANEELATRESRFANDQSRRDEPRYAPAVRETIEFLRTLGSENGTDASAPD